jgi:hypothetical protein
MVRGRSKGEEAMMRASQSTIGRLRRLVLGGAFAALLALGVAGADVQGDPSQWGVTAGDPSQWSAVAGDPSQWGVAGDPSQWGVEANRPSGVDDPMYY